PQAPGAAHQPPAGRGQGAAAHCHRCRVGPRYAPRLDHALCQGDDPRRHGRRQTRVPDGA
nr:hypothetical protein [Tanacetum cinerariifolium]